MEDYIGIIYIYMYIEDCIRNIYRERERIRNKRTYKEIYVIIRILGKKMKATMLWYNILRLL